MSSAATRSGGGVILLAAGRSRRFGSDKRALRLADGRTLLAHSIELYGSAFGRCLVVLRPDDDDPDPELADVLPAAPGIVRAESADLGMGHSLAAGARAARDWAYAFVALADMPWVEPTTLATLRAAMEQALDDQAEQLILQPTCAGVPGHPVGFSASFIEELGQLRGDEGARRVLRAHPAFVRQLEVGDPGVLRDLDQPDQIPAD